jgi:hypothetical protein
VICFRPCITKVESTRICHVMKLDNLKEKGACGSMVG